MSARPVADGKRYSPFAPDEVHADMRVDPVVTMRNVARNPHVVAAHRGCATCEELTQGLAPQTSRRSKVVISIPQLATALQLPPGTRVARMFVTDDPQVLHVVIEGEDLDDVPLTVETPLAQL